MMNRWAVHHRRRQKKYHRHPTATPCTKRGFPPKGKGWDVGSLPADLEAPASDLRTQPLRRKPRHPLYFTVPKSIITGIYYVFCINRSAKGEGRKHGGTGSAKRQQQHRQRNVGFVKNAGCTLIKLGLPNARAACRGPSRFCELLFFA